MIICSFFNLHPTIAFHKTKLNKYSHTHNTLTTQTHHTVIYNIIFNYKHTKCHTRTTHAITNAYTADNKKRIYNNPMRYNLDYIFCVKHLFTAYYYILYKQNMQFIHHKAKIQTYFIN